MLRGTLANRIKTVLPKIINSDQTGFIPGRYIGENTRLIYDIMHYTEENNIPGTLLMIDFEKAFDSVSWNFIQKSLQFYNFGPSFQKWIQVTQSNSISAVTQAGFLSSFFNLERGCRQGDPISSYIFLVCAEILATRIRHNNNIKGITINETEHKLTLYADDTTAILDGSEKSLREAVKEINDFYLYSGLKINISKTQITWIGSKKNILMKRLCADLNLNWTTRFVLLGITNDVDLTKITTLNYDKKLVKIKSIIEQWSKRNLTLIGKLCIIKTLLISQLNHLFISLPNPPENTLKSLKCILFNFLWNSKVEKIKRNVLYQKHEYGGVEMIDIEKYISGLKTTWIRRILTNDQSKWKLLLNTLVPLSDIISFGPQYLDDIIAHINNPFWKDVFNAWLLLRTHEKTDSWDEYISQPLWFNKDIKIDGKSIYIKQWFQKGIAHINDLITEDGNFLSLEKLQDLYKVRTNFLTYHGIVAAIKRDIGIKGIESKNHNLALPLMPRHIKIFYKSKKGSKSMYDLLVSNKHIPTGQIKWNSTLPQTNLMWSNIYKLPFKLLLGSKLKWFQYRINHYILTTNKVMFKIGLSDTPLCTFCKNEPETILHLLWGCPVTQGLLSRFSEYCMSKNEIFTPDICDFIFGIFNNDIYLYSISEKTFSVTRDNIIATIKILSV